MGLATSQVRLLALTSRKADVELQIQLNSKRKTMLTRESSQLAKLYYAKLNNSKIQYATDNGFSDVNYNYLMGYSNSLFYDDVLTGSSDFEKKISNSMILTDNFGRVILDDSMTNIILYMMNHQSELGINIGENTQSSSTAVSSIEDLTLTALKLLMNDSSSDPNAYSGGAAIASSSKAMEVAEYYNNLLENYPAGANFLLRNGYQNGGTLYVWTDPDDSNKQKLYSKRLTNVNGTTSSTQVDTTTQVTSLMEGYFYKIIGVGDDEYRQENSYDSLMCMNSDATTFNKNNFYDGLDPTVAKQIARMMEYYGSIFSAAFNGRESLDVVNSAGETVNTTPQSIAHYNIAAHIVYNNETGEYILGNNNAYSNATNVDTLQDGLKSGIYQLVNVANRAYGGYSKGQNLDYFRTQNLIVEKNDNDEREQINTWYESEKADLNEKESYWDSEISALSTELETITTEIESVKSLRKDAISSTFKWGEA